MEIRGGNTLEQVIVLNISLLNGRMNIADASGLSRVEIDERVFVIVESHAGTEIPTTIYSAPLSH